MHHAIEIQEILYNIFLHCAPPEKLTDIEHTPVHHDLLALARTCRAFKEPALDVLWMALVDLSPLARCLPEVSHRLFPGNMYAFTRQLMQTEWDILQGYTRRIRTIHFFQRGLDVKSFEILSNPLTAQPLFPNLQYLRCQYTQETMGLLHQPLPSLIDLEVAFPTSNLFQISLDSFPMFSPNIRKLSIDIEDKKATVNVEPNYIYRWSNLGTVYCPRVALDIVTLEHLSRMPALTRLLFTLTATPPAFDSPLLFSHLKYLLINAESLHSISQFLSQTRLPVITDLLSRIKSSPSRQERSSFLSSLLTSNTGHTIEALDICQTYRRPESAPSDPLGLEDLQPYMAFSNLRTIAFCFYCNVGLTDGELLALAPAWPKLEHLLINSQCGWKSQGGITSGGLVRLLETCRALSHIALRLDTRGYTQVLPSHVSESFGFARRTTLTINVLDAAIEEESIQAIASFLSGIAASCESRLSLRYWTGVAMVENPNLEKYNKRWHIVRDRMSRSRSLQMSLAASYE